MSAPDGPEERIAEQEEMQWELDRQQRMAEQLADEAWDDLES